MGDLRPGLRVGGGAPVEDEDVDEDDGRDADFGAEGPVAGVVGVEGAFPVDEDVGV